MVDVSKEKSIEATIVAEDIECILRLLSTRGQNAEHGQHCH
jgi:hypothetical protein